jgi:hypothetical protein
MKKFPSAVLDISQCRRRHSAVPKPALGEGKNLSKTMIPPSVIRWHCLLYLAYRVSR